MRNRLGGAWGALLFTLVLQTAWGADPYVGYIYPSGLQAGTTNRLVVGGQGFWGLMEAAVTGEGVHVLHVERMPQSAPPASSQLVWLRKWLDNIILRDERMRPAYPTNAAARVGEWTVNAWWQTLDQLDRRELEAVERDIFVRKNQLQMTPSLRQTLFVDVAVDADAKPGRRSFTTWTQFGIAPPRPLLISAAPHVEEPLYVPPHRKKAAPPEVCRFPCVLDGRILPGETDRFKLVLRQGRRLTCDVTARELQPYVGDAVPGFFNAVVRLLGPDGKEIAFADDHARFRPDPAFSVIIPADGVYTLEIHDNLFRGREDFVYSVALDEVADAIAPKVSDDGGTPSRSGASHWYAPWTWGLPRLEVGGEVKGAIAPGVKDAYKVELEGPGTFVFDLRARRDGSSLDGVLTLTDADGHEIWRHDDVTNTLFVGTIAQAECDARGQLTLADGERRELTVTVEDLTGHGGADYFYALSLTREQPDFAVYASRSAFLVRRGARQPFTLHVVRMGGFDGPITLLPGPDYHFEGGYLPAGSNQVQVSLLSTQSGEAPLRTLRLRALGEVGGLAKVVDVVPTDVAMQAFAWTHLVPADAFLFKTMLPPPPRLQNPMSLKAIQLVGRSATPELLADVRRLLKLRRPKAAVEIEALPKLPSAAELKAKPNRRPMLLTPMPFDLYAGPCSAVERAKAQALCDEADAVRHEACLRGVPLVDFHQQFSSTLQERPYMRLMGEDRSTPSEEMRLMMLGRLLEQLGGDLGEVCTTHVNAAKGGEVTSRGKLRDLAMTPQGGTFTYVAHALPWPLTEAYRKVDPIYPITQRFNREMLFVANLAPGRYALVMDGRRIKVFSAAEFAKGINLALLDTPAQRRVQIAFARGETPNAVPVRVEIRPSK